jgi:hypothetical protein
MESLKKRQQYKAMMNQLKEKCLASTVKRCIPKGGLKSSKAS